MSKSEHLEGLRGELDRLDHDIVAKLAQRQRIIAAIGEFKEASGTALRDHARERDVLRAVDAAARAEGLNPHFAIRLYREIIDHSIRSQGARLHYGATAANGAAISVGYLGGNTSYQQAAERHFSAVTTPAEYVAFATPKQMLDATASREIDYAVLPIENTMAGSLNESYQLLVDTDLSLVGEELDDVEGSGSTRYVIVSANPISCDSRVPCKTSLLFVTRDEKGALMSCLNALASRGVNFSKLESRPRARSGWEYQFYLDFEGNRTDPIVVDALSELASRAVYLKVLGSYPARTVESARVLEPQLVPVKAERSDSPQTTAVSTPKPSGSHRLVTRQARGEDTVVRVGRAAFGGKQPVIIAGPCAVETWEQVLACAVAVRDAGGDVLRGGVFKPRTSPYSFQGLGHTGLALLREAGRATGLPVVTEVLSPSDVSAVASHIDILQIGARNMQNFALLKEVGRIDKPVILKRGLSASIEEWLAAAEHILAQGNQQVILCERGIRTFETATRNTLDLGAIPVVRERTHLPVIVDPSHAAGVSRWVPALSEAAVAAGAQGLMIEIHPSPADALSDGPQALTFPMFTDLMVRLRQREPAMA